MANAEKTLMKGNEAIAEAAIQCGCRFFFGYPITPQNEIPEYMSRRMPQVEGTFLQAESEVAAINMVYGASGAGARVMTSSSSPGISLKQEGISYCVGAELPCVIVNIVRGGPGLGSIQGAQSDYFQSTRGGGHGDYRTPCFAPSTVQEAVELTQEAFDVADRYRNPVLVVGDGLLGSMMEPVVMKSVAPDPTLAPKDWAATGWDGKSRKRSVVNSLIIDPLELEQHNIKLAAKYAAMEAELPRGEGLYLQDASVVVVAYGTMARIARSAVERARQAGVKAGLYRPITLWPFPGKEIAALAENPGVSSFLAVEMSAGQMVEDVRLFAAGKKPVSFYGRAGGAVPTVQQVQAAITAQAKGC